MKNVTITLDDKTVAWARKHAAERNVSLSRFISEVLQKNMQEARDYERAMRQFLATKPVKLGRPGQRYPTRDEIHERGRIR
jgi:hypothetical protein